MGSLSGYQIVTHVILGPDWEVHVFHGCVCHVHLGLEFRLLSIGLSNQHSHISEDCGIVQDEECENQEHDENLKGGSGSHFVTTEGQNCHVQHYQVLVSLVYLLFVIESEVLAPVDIDEVERRHPLSIVHTIHKEEPRASNHMHQ